MQESCSSFGNQENNTKCRETPLSSMLGLTNTAARAAISWSEQVYHEGRPSSLFEQERLCVIDFLWRWYVNNQDELKFLSSNAISFESTNVCYICGVS